MTRARQSGLSLVEVLVSLTIFSVIGAASLALLQSLARTEARLSDQTQGLELADRAFTAIDRSLANARSVTFSTDTLTVAIPGATLVYVTVEGHLVREVTSAERRLAQPLAPVRSVRWSVSETATGRVLVMDVVLESGLSGRRMFLLPSGIS